MRRYRRGDRDIVLALSAGGQFNREQAAPIGRSPRPGAIWSSHRGAWRLLAASFETRPPDWRWKQHDRGTAKMEDLEILSFHARRCHRPD